DDHPSYFAVRRNESGAQQWIFLHYSPDTTQLNKNLAREKMLYAATRATLVRELGDSHFATSIFGSDKNAFSWEGYKSHLASLTGAKPYSPRELELLEIKEAEKAMKSSTDKRSHAPGIAFPLTDRALAALQKLQPQEEAPAERTVNFVTLAIDNESVDLIAEDKISAKELSKRIDGASPRFTFFAYEHTHKGTAHDSLVFIYTCPTGSKIKERMVYASGRAGVLQEAKERAGLNVDKKLETADVKELTEHHILEELYPPQEPSSSSVSGAKGFKKPVGPRGGVGARKVMF
ncbi:MAG: hypothetical protein J3Q66DRAFT_409872, partial [Benniella sp.]